RKHTIQTNDPAYQRINLAFQQVPGQTLFEVIAALSNIDIIVTEPVHTALSVQLKAVSVLDAVQLIASMLKLQAHYNPELQLIQITDSQCRNSFCRAEKVLPIRNRPPKKLAQILQKSLAAIAPSIQITPDEDSSHLILTGTPHALEHAIQLATKLDQPRAIVLIEAWVLEISDDSRKQLDLELGIGHQAIETGLSIDSYNNLSADSEGFVFRSMGDNLSLKLDALARKGYTRILSNPRIYVIEGEQAEIFQGDEVPYTTRTTEGTTHTEFRQAGLGLKVRPLLQADGHIELELEINKDTVDQSRDNPPISKREIRTQLIIKRGEFAFIGGIGSSEESGISRGAPGLKNIAHGGAKGHDQNQLLVILSAWVSRSGMEHADWH
ncbi:MAG: type II secretion system protein GspD, partial [Gammaproteobacteria bacterium]